MDYRDRPGFKAISRRIIYKRAKNRCERCGVHNNSVGYWQRVAPRTAPVWVSLVGEGIEAFGLGRHTQREARAFVRAHNVVRYGAPDLRVVKLQCAHLDHDETNDSDSNLLAMCQGCHRHHDSRDNAARREYGPTGQHRDQLTIFGDVPYARHPDYPRQPKPVHPTRRYVRRKKKLT
jgi:hypothetical protein